MRPCLVPILVVPLVLTATTVLSETPTPGAVSIQDFLQESVPICLTAPALDCIDVGWTHADADLDDHLSVRELDEIHGSVLEWFAWRREDLTRYEVSVLTVSLGVLNAVGLERLFDSYDANSDGLIDRAELLTDIVQLDARPLGQVLTDPKAVDRVAVAERLGALSPLLGRLLGQESR